MRKTVVEMYETSRKRLLKKSKTSDMPYQCDVLGVVRTIFPNISFEHSIDEVFPAKRKK